MNQNSSSSLPFGTFICIHITVMLQQVGEPEPTEVQDSRCLPRVKHTSFSSLPFGTVYLHSHYSNAVEGGQVRTG